KLASAEPLVTVTFAALAPGYRAAIAVRRASVPFDWMYTSRWRSTSSASPGTSSSSTDIGWTPLSERLWATRFSHLDCIRSISKGSSLMAGMAFYTSSRMGARLHHIALRVADPEAALRFYSGVLGLSEARRKVVDGVVAAVWLRIGDAMLMLERELRGAGAAS